MPNFSPNSIIRIGRVPFDNSYRHTMTFASASAQATYFTSVCTQALSQSDYTYVRMNNSIRVPFNAESLYTYNYVMYQNKNYGTKWFYAFIVGVNYVNENMTELVLELDVMQTWYFDYTLKECFVEREHVNDDTVGAHLNAEPMMDLQYTKWGYQQTNADGYFIVMLVNQLPHLSSDMSKIVGSDPVSGGVYQNFFSGCFPVIFYNNSSGLTAFQNLLDDMNGAGCADSICDIYTVPERSIPKPFSTYLQSVSIEYGDNGQTVTLPNTYTLSHAAQPYGLVISLSKPTKVDDYTPKNNKLLCYPYSYLELGDFSGRVQDYQWEYMPSSPALYDKCAAISDHVGYVTPKEYQGIVPGNNEPNTNPLCFTYNFTNKISWIFSAYQTWVAQNAIGNQLAVAGGIVSTLMGITSGITDIARGGSGTMGSSAAIGGVSSIANVFANYERMKRVPNTARGNTEGNSKYQNNYAGWYYCYVGLRAEYAEIVDKFFDMYGYQVDIVKVPNREGRSKWNYVKTANACFYGNVPADMMAKINSIYDSGITFWHTSDIGNYSAANTIVT